MIYLYFSVRRELKSEDDTRLSQIDLWFLFVFAEYNLIIYYFNFLFPQLDQVNSHLEKYLDRFRNQLGAGNRRYIQILMVITRAFLRLILGDKDTSSAHSCHAEEALGEKNVCVSTMNINDFLFSLNIDNINLVKLSRYLKESNIMHKVYSLAFIEFHPLSTHVFYLKWDRDVVGFLRSVGMELNWSVYKVVRCFKIVETIVLKEAVYLGFRL